MALRATRAPVDSPSAQRSEWVNGRREHGGTEERIAGGFDRVSRENLPSWPGSAGSLRAGGHLCQLDADLCAGTAVRCRGTEPSPAREADTTRLIQNAVAQCPAMHAPRCRDWWIMARTDDEREIRLRPQNLACGGMRARRVQRIPSPHALCPDEPGGGGSAAPPLAGKREQPLRTISGAPFL